jgi:hypothetical protein
MTKYIKFQVSEERFTILKAKGFEKIDQYMNELIDRAEGEENGTNNNRK